MNRTLLSTLVAGLMLGVSAPALAQSIGERQTNMERRIEEAVRGGGLSRGEANQLRNELYALERLEYDYRRGGFADRERREVQRRLDDLSRRIERQRADPQRGAPVLRQRLDQLEQNIREGERGGGLTQWESEPLRRQLWDLQRRFEQGDRSGGFSGQERAELNRQIEALANRILAERRDNEQGRGYGPGYGGGPGYGNGPGFGRGRGRY